MNSEKLKEALQKKAVEVRKQCEALKMSPEDTEWLVHDALSAGGSRSDEEMQFPRGEESALRGVYINRDVRLVVDDKSQEWIDSLLVHVAEMSLGRESLETQPHLILIKDGKELVRLPWYSRATGEVYKSAVDNVGVGVINPQGLHRTKITTVDESARE
jgi:hypothetical protein